MFYTGANFDSLINLRQLLTQQGLLGTAASQAANIGASVTGSIASNLNKLRKIISKQKVEAVQNKVLEKIITNQDILEKLLKNPVGKPNQDGYLGLNQEQMKPIPDKKGLKDTIRHYIKKIFFKQKLQVQIKKQQMDKIRQIPQFNELPDVKIQKVANIYNQINPNNIYIRNIQYQINKFSQQKNIFIGDQLRNLITLLHLSKALIPNIIYGPDAIVDQAPFSDLYRPGEFSQFAKQTQQKLAKKDVAIDQIIRQAVLSYEKKIKQTIKHLKQFIKLNETQKQILQLFENQTDIKVFLQNPLNYSIRESYKSKNLSLDYQLKRYFKRRMILRKSAQIDGKFIDVLKLRLKQRFYANRHLFIPVQNSNLYVKLTETGQKTKVIFRNGQFFDQKEISYLGEEAKQEIMAMVILFLKKKEIILQQSKLTDIMEKIANTIDQKM